MPLDSFYLLIIALMMTGTFRTASATTEQPRTTLTPCGQYGFRCLDSKSFQICTAIDDDDPEPEAIHECRDGLVCDEDNPAYCTPIDPMFTTIKTFGQRQLRDANDQLYAELNDGSDDCICVTERTTTEIPTTVEEDSTTELQPPPEFDCESYGFYPDFTNQTLFWFCDVPENGQGFYIRHMICGQDRVFDPLHHACVLLGTTRNTRKKDSDKKQRKRHQKFTCCGKAPGRYADDCNCRLYHYCLTKEFAPVDELTLICPPGTAYDPYSNKCSCYATYRCMNRQRSEKNNSNINNNINEYNNNEDYPQEFSESDSKDVAETDNGKKIDCQTPMRFRDVNYCDGYFLCYGDQVIEMDCPEYYKFDDNLLECLPERIAQCQ